MKSKLKEYKLVIILLLTCFITQAQHIISGKVTTLSKEPLQGVKIYGSTGNTLAQTGVDGSYRFLTEKKKIELVYFLENYSLFNKQITISKEVILDVVLNPYSEKLTEVEITAKKRKVFEILRLKDVQGTAIYAGKKSEVVLVSQSTAALASNNARQIYSQVVGLNIFQNDDAGLQLNIGGRGLDPNRTSNFNTRQNGYDISADVLGYPESYYTPPAEALDQIQVVRGAASLQYGTQFGGLVNFILKKPVKNKSFEFLTRSTLGSNNLYTNFTSISGTKNKFSYLAYYNYKQGDGFRPNSEFNSKNAFLHLGYQFNEKTKLEGELTYLKYLAHQAGGLTDKMFYSNPYQSNRERNWFQVDWLLYNLKLSHQFSDKTNFIFNFFGLNASRKALGYRTNRVNQVENGTETRDLITGAYKNFGFESRLLTNYNLLGKKSIFLIGTKFYKSNNTSIQGPGEDGNEADFSSAVNKYPYYRFQTNFKNPNLNVALFGENIVYLSEKISVTPGFRFEYINTGTNGTFKEFEYDGQGNPRPNSLAINNKDDENIRSFFLFGLGLSYKPTKKMEVYGNISQNYRSVTFSDLNIVNPTMVIDPDLTDENGFTVDLGLRGNYKKIVSYDIGAFGLIYNDRIGFQDDYNPSLQKFIKKRTNIGNARVLGIESLIDINIKKILGFNNKFSANVFFNTSYIKSKYTEAKVSGYKGNQVEFVPEINYKTGLKFGYKNFKSSVQYSLLSSQFTDASNAVTADIGGITGLIPAYEVLDFSTSYKYKYFKIEAGVNNALNAAYFTRRATGYPGPGIIPSSPRNWYVTLQFKI